MSRRLTVTVWHFFFTFLQKIVDNILDELLRLISLRKNQANIVLPWEPSIIQGPVLLNSGNLVTCKTL
jgi:hypothetical protein